MRATSELEPYDFRDPGETIAEVALREPLRDGDVRVALVREPSGAQELVDVLRLPRREWRTLGDWELSRYLEDKVELLPVPERTGRGPNHATLTIIARPGFTVIGPDEARWLKAWMFCNHLKPMYTASLAVVTEHGWTEFMTGLGAAQPALRLMPVS